MKRAFLLPPLFAAGFFTLSASILLIQRSGSEYTPVLYELLLLVSGYFVATLFNLVVIIPFCLLLKNKTIFAGFTLALGLAFTATTVAYAYEIFGIASSILAAVYFFSLFVPVFVMVVSSFYLITRLVSKEVSTESKKMPDIEDDSDNRENS